MRHRLIRASRSITFTCEKFDVSIVYSSIRSLKADSSIV
jgi:hypothetical protein